MKKFIAGIALLSFGVVCTNSFAATPEEVMQEGPPVQMQKDKVPDSTSNGNYLEMQPDENGAVTNGKESNTTNSKHTKKSKYGKKNAGDKSSTMNKGKQTSENPTDGGMTVEQK